MSPIDPDELRAAIIASQQQGECSPELAQLFLQLARNLSQRKNFHGYSYVEDLVQDGAARCCKYFMKYNVNSLHSPFSYFTRVLWNSFLQGIDRENKHVNLMRYLCREEGYPEMGHKVPVTCLD